MMLNLVILISNLVCQVKPSQNFVSEYMLVFHCRHCGYNNDIIMQQCIFVAGAMGVQWQIWCSLLFLLTLCYQWMWSHAQPNSELLPSY